MKKLIYILEDTEDIIAMIKLILADEPYDVRGFGDLGSFINGLEHGFPDLCVLDINVPDGSGLELCSWLKSRENLKDIPVIIMSAHVKIDEMSAGCIADDYIEKPFDIDVLAQKVSLLLGY